MKQTYHKSRPTRAQVAQAVGISRRTLSGYRQAGCDTTSVEAVLAHRAGLRHHGVTARTTPDLAAARARLVAAQADKAEIELASARAEMIPLAQVREAVRVIRDTVGACLGPLVAVLPAKLAGLAPGEMQDVVRAAVDDVLHRLAAPDTYGA